MQKLIPTIYFYVVSLIGFVLLIIGIFNSISYVVNVTSYSEYPLSYNTPDRCAPLLAPAPDGKTNTYTYQQCLMDIKADRQKQKTNDLEKALSFTLIGLAVFSSHFIYARKKLK